MDMQAGAQGADSLPDRFYIKSTSGSASPQLVLIHREVDMDAWVLDTNVSPSSPGLHYGRLPALHKMLRLLCHVLPGAACVLLHRAVSAWLGSMVNLC